MAKLNRREKGSNFLSKIEQYRQGGEGFIQWAEENMYIPVYRNDSPIPNWTLVGDLSREPVESTGRSFWEFWCNQKEVLREALKMEFGRLKHRLIIFCWPRGEGKSALACFIQLWKFFCFPRQQIMLGANSKDQVKFVHFDIMKDIILNSPNLLAIVGKRNVKEKEIVLLDKNGNTGSMIRSISSFSGIVSNITGYTFSEMFDMKNPKFFVQLDGSIRNMPNALGVIDSTVSETSHILYKLYQTSLKGKDKTLFFHYRCSPNGDAKDMWHPYNSQEQLDSYREKFPEVEFNRYFKNIWSAGSNRFFKDEYVMATRYLGHANILGQNEIVQKILKDYLRVKQKRERKERIDGNDIAAEANIKMLTPATNVYQLRTETGHPRMASFEELQTLSSLYNTDFSILSGVDRADPMKIDKTKGARTILSIIAKGLPNSRNNPSLMYDEKSVHKYIYFVLNIVHVASNELDDVKYHILEAHEEYQGVDVLCAERWGMWDVGPWCEENDIIFEAIQPTYDKQKLAFSELFFLYRNGMFICPPLGVKGTHEDDVLEEEALKFDHNPIKKWYGSPQKTDLHGVQDDAMFSVGWGIYGGRELTVMDFRSREKIVSFGEFYPAKTTGRY